MDHFCYLDGILHAEQVSLETVAGEYGTPTYVYSASAFADGFHEFDKALAGLDHQVCYAMKANSNQAILRLLADLGSGFDAVSGGEIARAKAAGVDGARIVFSGVGKTREEMRLALEGDVRQFNVESEPELLALDEVARSMGKKATIAFRVNPDVDARTHHKISTGKSENKFGIPIARARDAYRMAATLPGIRIAGLDMHIGSQITSLEPYERSFAIAAEFLGILRSDGHEITRMDLGGGLGVAHGNEEDSVPSPAEYCSLVRRMFGKLDCEIEIEPGRRIAGNSGILLSTVLYVKKGHNRSFLVLDAAMNDLIRPAMYDAYHEIVPVRQPADEAKRFRVDIVGPVCETGDTFARGRVLPFVAANDRVAFRTAGAYGAVMASEYNTRPIAAEVLVRGDLSAAIRNRESLDTVIGRDLIPTWL